MTRSKILMIFMVVCFSIAVLCIYTSQISHIVNDLPWHSLRVNLIKNWHPQRVGTPAGKSENNTLPAMTVMVRLTTQPALTKYFYCYFLRTVLLFWPASYGPVALILNKESAADRKFGNVVMAQVNKNFPEYNLKIVYEPLPKNPNMLRDRERNPTYARQLWSTFFADLYTNDSIIAYMDTDVLMITTITKQDLINGNKLKVYGSGFFSGPVLSWAETTQKALGLPLVGNFMANTFPQLVYRDTFINCRQYILKHLNTTDFMKAYNIFHLKNHLLSPINIILSYAWYFEKDRYDWHLKIPDLAFTNDRLPKGHKVQPENTVPLLVPVIHFKTWLPDWILPGYCLSLAAQGEMLPGCENVKHNLKGICDLIDGYKLGPWVKLGSEWCKGMSRDQCCQQAVDEHYKHVTHMARTGIHTVQRYKAALVSDLAKEMGVKCEPLGLP